MLNSIYSIKLIIFYLLLLALFFLSTVQNSQAQCNPTEYTRIFNEANALQKKGEFIEAKNRYEAAKIYACSQKERDAADSKVDKLFEQIESLRYNADSTAEANRRAALKTYANSIAFKSQTALRDGDRNTAFRLAEFAHRYVDDDNSNVTGALAEAYYYQGDHEDPSNTSLLWYSILEGQMAHIRNIFFSPGGKRLATALDDNTFKIWDANTGQETFMFNNVSCLRFSPTGKNIAAAFFDHTIRIWDLDSSKQTLTLKGHPENVTCMTFSPDGRWLASSSKDSTVNIWDLKSGNEILTFHGHSGLIGFIAFLHKGQWVITGSEDNTVKIWELATGKIVHSLEGRDIRPNEIALSQDGKIIAIQEPLDKVVKIWDLDSGKIIHTLGIAKTHNVAFSPDGKWLATTWSDTLKIWNIDTEENTLMLEGQTSGINSIAFSPDGKWLATGSDDQTAKIWNLAIGKVTYNLKCFTSSVTSVAFSPDGRQLVTVSSDNIVKIWDLDSDPEATTIVTNVKYHGFGTGLTAFSPDFQRFAAIGIENDEHVAEVWDLITGKEILKLRGHTSYMRSVAFSPDGRQLATSAFDNTIKIWDLNNGKENWTLNIRGDEVVSLTFSPDGRRLATGSEGNIATIWDLDSGQEILKFNIYFDHQYYCNMAFSPDGRWLATGSDDNAVKIWDLDKGKAIFTFKGNYPATSISFTSDGRRLAIGYDKIAKIWDLNSDRATLTLEGHSGAVLSLAFSPDGRQIITGSYDNTAKIWDLESGKTILTLEGQSNQVSSVSFSPDGQRVATGIGSFYGASGIARIWELAPNTIISKLQTKRRLATLTLSQLETSELQRLLDIKEDNEERLLQTQEPWQIAAFADLAVQSTINVKNLSITAKEYARAARLYQFAFNISGDTILLKRLGMLYLHQAFDILSSTRPDTALQYALLALQLLPNDRETQIALTCALLSAPVRQEISSVFDPEVLTAAGNYFKEKENWKEAQGLYEKALTLKPSPQNLLLICEICESGGLMFDYNRFFQTDEPEDFFQFANYFKKTKNWALARDLYEKGLAKKDSPSHLLDLYEVCQKGGFPFDFNRFLQADDLSNLFLFADYFGKSKKWTYARDLYEKGLAKKDSPDHLLDLYEVCEKGGFSFDFNRFLQTDDPDNLFQFADYLKKKEIWTQVRILCEKVLAKKNSPETLFLLYEVGQKEGFPFDFNRFLQTNEPKDLKSYQRYFSQKGNTDIPSINIPRLQCALNIGNKLLTLQNIDENRISVARICNSLAWNQLFTSDFFSAEENIRRGIELDPENKYLPTNLPHTLLFQGRFGEAKVMYQELADKPFGEQGLATYRYVFLDDFKIFRLAGIIPKHLDEIEILLQKD